MLAIEIDDLLPDHFEELPTDIAESIRTSRCCHCGKEFGEGRMIMYVVHENKTVQWWHHVDWRVINRFDCQV